MLGLYVPQCSISFVELGIYSKVGGALHLAEARQKQWGVSLGTKAHPRPRPNAKKTEYPGDYFQFLTSPWSWFYKLHYSSILEACLSRIVKGFSNSTHPPKLWNFLGMGYCHMQGYQTSWRIDLRSNHPSFTWNNMLWTVLANLEGCVLWLWQWVQVTEKVKALHSPFRPLPPAIFSPEHFLSNICGRTKSSSTFWQSYSGHCSKQQRRTCWLKEFMRMLQTQITKINNFLST